MSAKDHTALLHILILIMGIGALPRVRAAEKQDSPLEFYYEGYGVPQFDSLLNEFDYAEAAARGRTEFEQMLILMDWVFEKVVFNASDDPELRNGLKVLRWAEKGGKFYCHNTAAVFMQCAQSLGWTARYYMGTKPPQYTRVPTHSLNDIWSNQYRKWIMMDVTWNTYITKDGIPQSVYEIRTEYFKNEGVDLTLVFAYGAKEKRFTSQQFPLNWVNQQYNPWNWWPIDTWYYGYHFRPYWIARNNFFTWADGNGNAKDWDKVYTIKDAYNQSDTRYDFYPLYPPPEYTISFTTVNNIQSLFHGLNRTDIAAVYAGGNTMTVTLGAFGQDNYTPNFQEFLVKANSGEWEVKPKTFSWTIPEGRNELRVKALNKFGLAGPPSTMVVVDQPSGGGQPVISKISEPYHGMVFKPVIKPAGGTFTGTVTATVSGADTEAELHYTTDGSEPTLNSMKYTAPLTFTEPAVLKVRGFRAGLDPSVTVSAAFTIVPEGIPGMKALEKRPFPRLGFSNPSPQGELLSILIENGLMFYDLLGRQSSSGQGLAPGVYLLGNGEPTLFRKILILE